MIRIKLSELLGKNKMNQKNLAELAHIRPATVSKMYYEEIKRLDIKHINNICKTFNCTISDLLEYIPDDDNITNEKKQEDKPLTNFVNNVK